jgi:hypothetical protein
MEVLMTEEQARETEAEETREESGDPAEGETAQEQQQEVEEHDWGAMTARIDALEQQVQGLAAAMATISAAAEDEDGKPAADMPDEEYGAALDLDDEDLAGMLGL